MLHLAKDFINQYTLNNYTDDDYQLVELYKTLFNDTQRFNKRYVSTYG